MAGMRSLLLALGVALAAGCYAHSGYPPPGTPAITVAPPPQPVVEVPPPEPRLGMVWTAGYWDWRTDHYGWVPGKWVVPPRSGVVYLPPRWQEGRRGWYLVPPRWVAGQARDRHGRLVWFDSLGRPHYF